MQKKITMNTPFQPPFLAISGFPPTELLLASLITISNEISSTRNLPRSQVKNILAMVQRVRLLSPLFEEVRELNVPPLSSTVLCFTELLSQMTRVKFLIHGCTEGSYLWNLIQTEVISKEFHAVVKKMSKVLDILPLSSINITVDVKEQVDLLLKQAKRVDLLVDPKELERKKVVCQIIETNKENKDKIHGSLDVGRVKEMLSSIGLKSSVDFEEEVSKLKAEAKGQGGTGGPIVVSRINILINLLVHVRSMIFSLEENERASDLLKQKIAANKLAPSTSKAIPTDAPSEFRCPISDDIMREPVVVATGHTYDRDSISQWIISGRKRCPKSGWKLAHMALIPNYNLKSMIHQWHQDNNVYLDELRPSTSSQNSNTNKRLGVNAVKFISEFLVGKLATASPAMQCRAAYETQLLAKSSRDNRKALAEAGAIPFLVNLLNSNDPAMQEDAVTALLNLSINSDNKRLIMEADALEKITVILENGKRMEAKENAAATISSLLAIDDYKAFIGAQHRIIAALVCLLREGESKGKSDATIALTNLALYNANQKRVVQEGTVPLLINMLMDEKAGITDDASTLLALLAGCSEGMEEIIKTTTKDLMILLIDLLRFGSPKGKENSVILLLALTKEGPEVVRHLNPQSFSLLRNLIANGSSESREKAGLLLRELIKCCSNPANL